MKTDVDINSDFVMNMVSNKELSLLSHDVFDRNTCGTKFRAKLSKVRSRVTEDQTSAASQKEHLCKLA